MLRIQVTEEGKLRTMTATLSARSETLEHAAFTDALTGMQNRRYFDHATSIRQLTHLFADVRGHA